PEAEFEARTRRNLVERDGQTFARPDAETLRKLRVMDEFVDAVPVVKQLKGRFLMLLSTRDFPGLPPRFAPLMAAHRAGLRRDLADTPSNVTVTDIATSHDAIREAPAEAAERVLGFLGQRR
ncbi:MAG: alpha/beta fold hydrolase, partial [Stackebrandtia sp.]